MAGRKASCWVSAVLTEYQEHYNTGRPHQGIAQRVPTANLTPPAAP